MYKLAKNKWLITTLLLGLFILAATNALLFWHIISEGGHEHHDSDHCHICQNVFINSSKAIITVFDASLFFYLVESEIEYFNDSPISILIRPNLIPRAPPA